MGTTSELSSDQFLKDLFSKRSEWVEANRKNNFDEGLNNLLSDLYPDDAHFIFELLQNAEDALASKVRFHLVDDLLVFSHNGSRLFNNDDVDGITGIGISDKKEDVTQIGKFGVGFKSVFAYTTSPRVFSGDFQFEINDLVCPTPLPKTNKDPL